ncbi:MAG: hypothetical protein KKA05_02690, partial [Alphaproteobacteria bacterium]|nr:hypothetical protein [Alphaproteobacteria bacterium]
IYPHLERGHRENAAIVAKAMAGDIKNYFHLPNSFHADEELALSTLESLVDDRPRVARVIARTLLSQPEFLAKMVAIDYRAVLSLDAQCLQKLPQACIDDIGTKLAGQGGDVDNFLSFYNAVQQKPPVSLQFNMLSSMGGVALDKTARAIHRMPALWNVVEDITLTDAIARLRVLRDAPKP